MSAFGKLNEYFSLYLSLFKNNHNKLFRLYKMLLYKQTNWNIVLFINTIYNWFVGGLRIDVICYCRSRQNNGLLLVIFG